MKAYDRQWRRIVQEAIARSPRCAHCRATSDLTGDHVLPVSLGGLSTRANCVVLCRSCNSRKHNRVTHYQLTLDPFWSTTKRGQP